MVGIPAKVMPVIRGRAVSMNVVAIVAAVLVAFVLGAFAGYLVRALSIPVAALPAQVAAVHPPYAVGPGTREPAGLRPLGWVHAGHGGGHIPVVLHSARMDTRRP
jgi:hypothetical protein